MRTVPLDVAPERRTKRCSTRFRPTLLLPAGREKVPGTSFSTEEPKLPQKSPKSEKKSFHNFATVGKLSSRATFLSYHQDKVRVSVSKIWICEWGGVPKVPLSRSRDESASLGMHSRVWNFPGSGNRTQVCVPPTSTHAQNIPLPVKNSLRGTPEKKSQRGSKIATLSSCSGRAFSAPMTIFDLSDLLNNCFVLTFCSRFGNCISLYANHFGIKSRISSFHYLAFWTATRTVT